MKSRQLDQFYTKPEVAQKLYQKTLDILYKDGVVFDSWLEPSAGSGSFYNLLPENKVGIDLDPKIDSVIEHDFLTYPLDNKNYITIGNPPFGKNASLAIKFFNKCAEKSLYIAFVLPKTFKKNSTFKKINQYFHLVYEEELEVNSFTYNDLDYDVPCVFQIWKKENAIRMQVKEELVHCDFLFTNKEDADFAIQRVGVNAGKAKLDFHNYAISSHYFIKSLIGNEAYQIFNKIDYSSVKYNTAGNPSISKAELIKLYKLYKQK